MRSHGFAVAVAVDDSDIARTYLLYRGGRPDILYTQNFFLFAPRGHPQSVEHLTVQTKNFRLVGILARTLFCEHAMKKFFSRQNFSEVKFCRSSSIKLKNAALLVQKRKKNFAKHFFAA